ncbi:hypothetical protein HYW74_00285 [Candidatus Pacearchaeota archaeon]|nr:hypothetical protein [Candidatus Pacearchaeota archaeon]
MDNPKIKTSFIIEMMGRPAEHLDETLNKLVEEISSVKGVSNINKIIHPPKLIEEKEIKDEKIKNKIDVKKELYTSFAEIEADFDGLESMFTVVFNYMPSHFEIISPEEFKLRNSDFAGIIAAVIIRLHRYDEIAKKMSMDRIMIENKLREIFSQHPEMMKVLQARAEEEKNKDNQLGNKKTTTEKHLKAKTNSKRPGKTKKKR